MPLSALEAELARLRGILPANGTPPAAKGQLPAPETHITAELAEEKERDD